MSTALNKKEKDLPRESGHKDDGVEIQARS